MNTSAFMFQFVTLTTNAKLKFTKSIGHGIGNWEHAEVGLSKTQPSFEDNRKIHIIFSLLYCIDLVDGNYHLIIVSITGH